MSQHHIEVKVCTKTFINNIIQIRQLVSPAQVCVVVKANAYGHGIAKLAPKAVEAGADYLGVCTNPEARIIRNIGLKVKLLRLRMALPEELEESIKDLDLEEQIGTMEAANYLSTIGVNQGRNIPIHLNIDMGMGRSGFFSDRLDQIQQVCSLPGIKVVGIMTHFPSADGDEVNTTKQRLNKFEDLCHTLKNSLPEDVLIHTHNSAATIRLTSKCHNLVRVGAACYGVRTSQAFTNPAELKPVMSVKTKIAQVRKVPAGKTIGYGSLFTTKRDSLIASLPVGFGEGYPRSLFNKGIVLIHGYRCPVVGRVSLNITTVDITDIPEAVNWGDEAVLVGCQAKEEITFEELADKFGSVHTEINLMTGFMNEISYV